MGAFFCFIDQPKSIEKLSDLCLISFLRPTTEVHKPDLLECQGLSTNVLCWRPPFSFLDRGEGPRPGCLTPFFLRQEAITAVLGTAVPPRAPPHAPHVPHAPSRVKKGAPQSPGPGRKSHGGLRQTRRAHRALQPTPRVLRGPRRPRRVQSGVRLACASPAASASFSPFHGLRSFLGRTSLTPPLGGPVQWPRKSAAKYTTLAWVLYGPKGDIVLESCIFSLFFAESMVFLGLCFD